MAAFVMAEFLHELPCSMHDSMNQQVFSEGKPTVFTGLCNSFYDSHFLAVVVRRAAPELCPAMLIHRQNSPAA